MTALLKRAANVNLAIQVEEEPETKTPWDSAPKWNWTLERNTLTSILTGLRIVLTRLQPPSRIPIVVRRGRFSVFQSGSWCILNMVDKPHRPTGATER